VTQVALPFSDRPDASLVKDAMAGGLEAFNVLVRRWERRVYSYLIYVTNQPEDAFDLCQDVFMSAYANIGRLRNPGAFRPWLFKIAHNAAYSHLRKEKDREAVPLESTTSGVTAGVRLEAGGLWGRAESKLLVEEALGLLPPEQREALVLKFYQGLKFDEISEIQNCPVGTVKTRFYASFEHIRKILKS
jgi:RNA polymerase sigma-70 factor, ECF subfamily